MLVTTGSLCGRTTCLAVWPRRGVSVLVADAAFSHTQLSNAAARQWRRAGRKVRTWWLDGQAVDEIRIGDEVELLLHSSGWPFPFFSGRAQPAQPNAAGALEVLTGIDWQHRPVTLTRTASALTGTNAVLTADVGASAFAGDAR
jgi:hypothetical protein